MARRVPRVWDAGLHAVCACLGASWARNGSHMYTSTRSGARPRCLRAHQQLLALSRQRRKPKLITLTARRCLAAGGAETDEVVAQLPLTARGERDRELGEEVAALPVTPPAAAAEINAAQIGAAQASDADEIVEDVAQEAPEQAPLEMNQ